MKPVNTIEDVVKNAEYASMPYQIREMFEFFKILFEPLEEALIANKGKWSSHLRCEVGIRETHGQENRKYHYAYFLINQALGSVEIQLSLKSNGDYEVWLSYSGAGFDDRYVTECSCKANGRFCNLWKNFLASEMHRLPKTLAAK